MEPVPDVSLVALVPFVVAAVGDARLLVGMMLTMVAEEMCCDMIF